jgi:hypothetical protein
MQTQENRQQSTFPWKRLLVTSVIFLFIAICTIVLLLSTGHIIAYYWYYIIPVVLTSLGPMFTFLQ